MFYKYKIAFFLFLFLIISFQAVYATSSTSILKKGDSGDRVLLLQQELCKLGYLVPTQTTGYFGTITEAALIRFQKHFGIDLIGIAGPATCSKISKLLGKVNLLQRYNTLVIDPGHGGIDMGSVKNGIVEKEVTLDISKRIQAYFKNKKYNVILTRYSDTSVSELSTKGNYTQKKDLRARVKIINNNNTKLFLCIHVNSDSDKRISGSIVFYNSNNSRSMALAMSIQKALNNIIIHGKLREPNQPQTAGFYILRNSNIPGVLVETAFITNKQENKLLAQDSFKDKIAYAIYMGVINSGN